MQVEVCPLRLWWKKSSGLFLGTWFQYQVKAVLNLLSSISEATYLRFNGPKWNDSQDTFCAKLNFQLIPRWGYQSGGIFGECVWSPWKVTITCFFCLIQLISFPMYRSHLLVVLHILLQVLICQLTPWWKQSLPAVLRKLLLIFAKSHHYLCFSVIGLMTSSMEQF